MNSRNSATQKAAIWRPSQITPLQTGALIELSVLLGAYIAGLRGPELVPLKNMVRPLVLASNIDDDLDAEEDMKEDGPVLSSSSNR